MSKLHSSRWCDGIRVYCDDVIVQEFSLSVDGMSYKSSSVVLTVNIPIIRPMAVMIMVLCSVFVVIKAIV